MLHATPQGQTVAERGAKTSEVFQGLEPRCTPTQALEIAARRTELGWSQNGLARRIRKDPGHVSRWLRGAFTSAVLAAKIQRVLELAERRR